MFGPYVHRLKLTLRFLVFNSIESYFLRYTYIVLYTVLSLNTKNNKYIDLSA